MFLKFIDFNILINISENTAKKSIIKGLIYFNTNKNNKIIIIENKINLFFNLKIYLILSIFSSSIILSDIIIPKGLPNSFIFISLIYSGKLFVIK